MRPCFYTAFYGHVCFPQTETMPTACIYSVQVYKNLTCCYLNYNIAFNSIYSKAAAFYEFTRHRLFVLIFHVKKINYLVYLVSVYIRSRKSCNLRKAIYTWMAADSRLPRSSHGIFILSFTFQTYFVKLPS